MCDGKKLRRLGNFASSKVMVMGTWVKRKEDVNETERSRSNKLRTDDCKIKE